MHDLTSGSGGSKHRLLTTVLLSRPFTAAVIALLSGIALIGYFHPDWIVGSGEMEGTTSSGRGLGGGQAANRKQSASDSSARSSNDDDLMPMMLFASDVMLLVTGDDFFTPASARALRAAVEALEALPQVRRITWMDRAPPLNIFGLPEPTLPDPRASPERFAKARAKATENPMICGQLLSPDGRTLVLLLDMDWFFVRSDADCTDVLVETAVAAIRRSGATSLGVAVTGEMPIRLAMNVTNKDRDRKFQWIAFGVSLAMAAILFRGLSAVWVTATAPALGVFWTLGFVRFFQFEDNPFNHVVVPVLLSLVGFTDGVHLMTQIRSHRATGMGVKEATGKALDQVGLACFLTSLTTAIGFGSLSWARHNVVREFGWCCVIGVGLTFVAVVTVIPLVCSTPLARGVHRGHGLGWVEKNLYAIERVVDFVLARRNPVAIAAIALTLLMASLTVRLRPDERLLNAIPESHPASVALRQMDRAMGGLETAAVNVTWSRDIEPQSAEVVAVSDAIERLLRGEPLLGSPLGIATLIDALPGDQSAEQKAAMVDLLPTPLRRVFWQPESQRLQVVFRLQDIGIAQYGPVFERVTQGLRGVEANYPRFNLSLQGDAIWRWENLYQIVVDLAFSLGTASIVILFVLTAVYRSLRLGLISVIPNLFPLAATGSLMWLIGAPLELVSVLAFTVCLGIAVDDTIHFMTRYRDELRQSATHEEAIRRAFTGVGTALVMTTAVLLCGFATVLLSDMREHHIFATMGGATIAMALFGDLLFLPALLAVFTKQR